MSDEALDKAVLSLTALRAVMDAVEDALQDAGCDEEDEGTEIARTPAMKVKELGEERDHFAELVGKMSTEHEIEVERLRARILRSDGVLRAIGDCVADGLFGPLRLTIDEKERIIADSVRRLG